MFPLDILRQLNLFYVSGIAEFTTGRLICRAFDRILTQSSAYLDAFAYVTPYAVCGDNRIPRFILETGLANMTLRRPMKTPIVATNVMICSADVFPLVQSVTCRKLTIDCGKLDPAIEAHDLLLMTVQEFAITGFPLSWTSLTRAPTVFLSTLRLVEFSPGLEDHPLVDLRELPFLQTVIMKDSDYIQEIIVGDEGTSVQKIVIDGCNQLWQIKGVHIVQDVTITRCPRLPEEMFRCFGHPTCKTTRLDVTSTQYAGVDHLSSSIQELVADFCDIVDITGAEHCRKVSIRYARRIRDISMLQHVQVLDISGCTEIHQWPPICVDSCCEKMKLRLVAQDCFLCSDTPAFDFFASSFAEVILTESVHKISSLPRYQFVQMLCLRYCTWNLKTCDVFTQFKFLLHIELGPCCELQAVDGLGTVPCVTLDRCRKVSSLAPLVACEKLTIRCCDGIRDFSVLRSGKCKIFEAHQCNQIRSLRKFEHIDTLMVTGGRLLIASLSRHSLTRNLSVSGNHNMHTIGGDLSRLVRLDCSDCPKLSGSLKLPSVRTLNAEGTNLSSISHAPRLLELNVRRCSLESMDELYRTIPIVHV